jgi:L-alanine-DL-glutamate epimerase-like enolase superfamily enzyme
VRRSTRSTTAPTTPTTPIATGERVTTKYGFYPYLDRHLIDFAQPDLCACGGITEAVKIAAIADANRIMMAPPGPHGPAGALANFHFDAATNSFYIQETRGYEGQNDMDLHQGMVPIVRNGYCALPDRPGLGTVLDEKVAAKLAIVNFGSRGNGVGLESGNSTATTREAAPAGGRGGAPGAPAGGRGGRISS